MLARRDPRFHRFLPPAHTQCPHRPGSTIAGPRQAPRQSRTNAVRLCRSEPPAAFDSPSAVAGSLPVTGGAAAGWSRAPHRGHGWTSPSASLLRGLMTRDPGVIIWARTLPGCRRPPNASSIGNEAASRGSSSATDQEACEVSASLGMAPSASAEAMGAWSAISRARRFGAERGGLRQAGVNVLTSPGSVRSGGGRQSFVRRGQNPRISRSARDASRRVAGAFAGRARVERHLPRRRTSPALAQRRQNTDNRR